MSISRVRDQIKAAFIFTRSDFVNVHWEHYPEHDHAADNEEELYIPLEGSGTLHAEGQTYPMKRGVLIRVGAAIKRKIFPVPEGMTLLMLSDRPESQ
jgi:mannose-6-phosphate isomerase-like protein (cupin superfamily)